MYNRQSACVCLTAYYNNYECGCTTDNKHTWVFLHCFMYNRQSVCVCLTLFIMNVDV